MSQFDPWLDAEALAMVLQQAQAELVIVIGAEAWCEKCRAIRPAFDVFEANWSSSRRATLWMDLEEHGDFLGDYVPDDLPMLLHYREGQLLEAGVVLGFEPEGWAVQVSPRRDTALPSVWASLATADWAP